MQKALYYHSFFLRLRVAKRFVIDFLFAFALTLKALEFPFSSSLCSSLQPTWTDWRKLLVELSKFIKLDECGLIQTHVRNIYSSLKFRVWKYDMPRASEKIIMAEVGGHTSKFYKCSSWCKLSLMQGAPHGQDFTESYQYSLRWKLSLIQDNQLPQHLRKYKRQKPWDNVGRTQDGTGRCYN